MKLMKSLFLGTAAGFAAVAGAQAADLPSKKAAPVEYVRICSQFGAGFFYIPGSDTCLKVSGRVRADYIYTEPLTRASNGTSTRARGYLTLDSMTNTDWGPVRATTRVYVTKDSGSGATPTLDWATPVVLVPMAMPDGRAPGAVSSAVTASPEAGRSGWAVMAGVRSGRRAARRTGR